MLKDVTTDCPLCGEPTLLAVPVPEPGDEAVHMAHTRCRACLQFMQTIAHPDGAVEFVQVEGGEVRRLGVRRGLVDMAEVMHPSYAIWQPRGAAVSQFRHRPEVAQTLGEAMTRAQQDPRPLSVPRRIFVSYRWQDEASDRWVAMLVSELQARGNLVDFDRQLADTTRPPSVAEIVARIAACHVFLAVLDPAYVERVAAGPDESPAEGWVTDEVHTALALSQRGLVLLLGIWRRGDALLSIFRPFERGVAGNTFDVRAAGALGPVLDAWFVQRGKPAGKRAASRAATLLHASARALREGDTVAALRLAGEACDQVPRLADGHAQVARAAHAAHAHQQSLAAARRALVLDPQLDEMRVLGAAAALLLDLPQDAAALSREVLERDARQANARMLLGWALAKLQKIEEALGHYHEARRNALDLPQLYLLAAEACRMIDRLDDAAEWVRAGLARWPNHQRLLLQGAFAALEAGDIGSAAHYATALGEYFPQDRNVPRLMAHVQHQAWNDGPLPRLVDRVSRQVSPAHVVCTRCEVRIPVGWRPARLCAGCGVLRPEGEAGRNSCTACLAPGWAWVDGQHLCPFCTLQGLIGLDPPESPEDGGAPRRGRANAPARKRRAKPV